MVVVYSNNIFWQIDLYSYFILADISYPYLQISYSNHFDCPAINRYNIYAILYHIIYCAKLYYVVFYYIILYDIVLYYIILQCIVLYHYTI